MNMKYFLLLAALIFVVNFYLSAQDFTISPIQKNTMQSQAAGIVRNYETGLNNLGDSLSSVNEKEYFVTDIIQSLFVSNDVLVYNDLDPENLEPDDLKADVYLNNIVTKYSKGANFNFNDIKISDPFYLNLNSAFIKVEVDRRLKGYHLDNPVTNFQAIDLYISFVMNSEGNFGPPTIYSISNHLNNLKQFTKVKLEKEAEILNLTVLSPNESTVYKRGKSYQVVWRGSSNDKPIKLELFKDGKRVGTISERVLGSGFDWMIPVGTDIGNDYQIKIINFNNPDNAMYSQEFTIKRRVPLLLKIFPLAGIAAAGYLVLSGSDENQPEILPGPPGPN